MSKIQLTKTVLSFAALTMLVSCSQYWNRSQRSDNNMNQSPMVQQQVMEDSEDDQYDKCNDAKFTTQRDQSQTLGFLQPGYKLPQPKQAYVYKGENKPVVHHKKKVSKKTTEEVKKQPVMQDAYNKPQAETVTQTPAAEMTSPVMPSSSTPATPIQPATPVQPSASTDVAPATSVAPATPATPSAAMTEQKADAGAVANTAMHTGTSAQPIAPTAAPTAPTSQPSVMMGSATSLNFAENEVDLSAQSTATVDKVIEDLKANPNKNVKIESHAFVASGSTSDARRNSLQRAIKIRKYMIDKDIAPNRISVNAIEDANTKMNKVDITLEDVK